MAAQLRLPNRAVHFFFLRELAKEKAPGKSSGCLGDMKTFQVVKEYVQPATSKSKVNFIDCLVQDQLGKYQPVWCPGGTLSSLPGTPLAVGPTTYFVSHAWSYTFSGLVALVERHYAGLPETGKGTKFVPVFYWVDILAVTQHFAGDFKDHPDSDFPGVIRASKAVLFTMYPWRSPIAPTRVWCLFEALTAVQSEGVELEVLLDTGGSKDTGAQTVLTVAASVDVRSAQASVPSDKAYIMGCIRDGVGVEAFNAILRKRLKETLMAVTFKKASAARDSDALVLLIKAGAGRGPDNVIDVPRWLPYGTEEHVVSLLDGLSPSSVPRKLVLAGAEAGQDTDVTVMTANKNSYGAPVYSYMPLSGKVLAAVARLLRRQGDPAGAGAGAAGGGKAGASTHPARASVSSHGRRAGSVPGKGAGGSAGSGGVTTPSRAASKVSDAGSAAASNTDDPLGGEVAPVRGGGSGGGLKELWLRPGKVVQTHVSYRPMWASAEFKSPEESQLAGAVDPAWDRREKELQRTIPNFSGAVWAKYFDEHQQQWKKAQLAKLQAAAEARAAAEAPARLASERRDRGLLWSALGGAASLSVLGLYNGWLEQDDVAALGRALRQHRGLRELHLVALRPDSGYPGGLACLTRDLLAAALGSRSLERIDLQPHTPVALESLEVPAAAAWDLGGGEAIKEFVMAPVFLSPRAAKQLAELLAPLPHLAGGAVGSGRSSPRCELPGDGYPYPGDYRRAQAETAAPRHSPDRTTDLRPVLQVLEGLRSGAAAGPRAAALTHVIGLATGPGAAEREKESRGAKPGEDVMAAAQQHQAAHVELLRLAAKAAPPEYLSKLTSVLPAWLWVEAKEAEALGQEAPPDPGLVFEMKLRAFRLD